MTNDILGIIYSTIQCGRSELSGEFIPPTKSVANYANFFYAYRFSVISYIAVSPDVK